MTSNHKPTRFEASAEIDGKSRLYCEAKISGVTKLTVYLGDMDAEIAAFIVNSANHHAELLAACKLIAAGGGDIDLINAQEAARAVIAKVES